MKMHVRINTLDTDELLKINNRTDEELLAAAQMLAVFEAANGWRLSTVQFSDQSHERTICSDRYPDGENEWDDGDDYDCRLWAVAVIRNGDTRSYTYAQNGRWRRVTD